MELLPILVSVVGGGGLAGLIFGALRYNRQDAGEVVIQAKGVIESMRLLIDEQDRQYQRVIAERDACYRERDELRKQ